jgi:hypothetical protein
MRINAKINMMKSPMPLLEAWWSFAKVANTYNTFLSQVVKKGCI